jgi:hypothetical protein
MLSVLAGLVLIPIQNELARIKAASVLVRRLDTAQSTSCG